MKEGVEVPTISLGVGRFLNVNVNVEVWEEQPTSGEYLKDTPTAKVPRNRPSHLLSNQKLLLCPCASPLSTLSPPELSRVEAALGPKARGVKWTDLPSPQPEPHNIHCGFHLLLRASLVENTKPQSTGSSVSIVPSLITFILAVGSVFHLPHSTGHKQNWNPMSVASYRGNADDTH